MSKTITEESCVIHVDFRNKKVLGVNSSIEEVQVSDALKNFLPLSNKENFQDFTDQQRLGHSSHIIRYVKDFTFLELMELAQNGVVDMVELNKALGLSQQDQEEELDDASGFYSF